MLSQDGHRLQKPVLAEHPWGSFKKGISGRMGGALDFRESNRQGSLGRRFTILAIHVQNAQKVIQHGWASNEVKDALFIQFEMVSPDNSVSHIPKAATSPK